MMTIRSEGRFSASLRAGGEAGPSGADHDPVRGDVTGKRRPGSTRREVGGPPVGRVVLGGRARVGAPSRRHRARR